MAVSDILPGLGSPVVGTGDYAGWVYTIIGGMFIGMYSSTVSQTLTESSSYNTTGFYVTGRVDINIPVTLDTTNGNAMVVTNAYDSSLSRLTAYPSAANFRSSSQVGLRFSAPKSASTVSAVISIIVCGKVA